MPEIPAEVLKARRAYERTFRWCIVVNGLLLALDAALLVETGWAPGVWFAASITAAALVYLAIARQHIHALWHKTDAMIDQTDRLIAQTQEHADAIEAAYQRRRSSHIEAPGDTLA